jgi:hypothetical protein
MAAGIRLAGRLRFISSQQQVSVSIQVLSVSVETGSVQPITVQEQAVTNGLLAMAPHPHSLLLLKPIRLPELILFG